MMTAFREYIGRMDGSELALWAVLALLICGALLAWAEWYMANKRED